MKHLFLSYASNDRDRARILANALEEKGWTIWWDHELLAGQDYETKITEELEKSHGVVVLWSNASVKSKWVKAECRYATDVYKKTLLPVLLEKVQLPIEYYSLNTINLISWKGDKNDLEFKRLLDSLESQVTSKLSNELQENPPDETVREHTEQSLKRRDKSLLANNSPDVNEGKIRVQPNATTAILARFILLPFGIPLVILLISHLLIKVFG